MSGTWSTGSGIDIIKEELKIRFTVIKQLTASSCRIIFAFVRCTCEFVVYPAIAHRLQVCSKTFNITIHQSQARYATNVTQFNQAIKLFKNKLNTCTRMFNLSQNVSRSLHIWQCSIIQVQMEVSCPCLAFTERTSMYSEILVDLRCHIEKLSVHK